MSQPAPTVDLLARLAADPDEAAWTQLLERHGALLLRVARNRCRDSHLAEDAVQEALLYVRDHAGDCRAESEAVAVAWLTRIVASSVSRVCRRQTARVERDRRAGELEQGRSVDPPDELVAERELDRALHRALVGLSDQHRRPLELHYFAQLDHHAVGAALACSPGAARVRVHRALKQLRASLARLGVTAALGTITARLAADETPTATTVGTWQDLLHAPTGSGGTLPLAPSAGGQLVFTIKIALAAAVCGGLAVTYLGDDPPPLGAMPIGDPHIGEEAPADPPELARELTFSFEEATLDEVLAFLRDAGLRIAVHPHFEQTVRDSTPPITLAGTMRSATLLRWFEQLTDTTVETSEDGSLLVGPAMKRRLELVRGSLRADGITLAEAVAALGAWPGAPGIDLLAGGEHGRMTVDFPDLTLGDALDFISRTNAVTSRVHEGRILIFPQPPRRARAEPAEPGVLGAREIAVLRTLEAQDPRTVNLMLNDVELAAAIRMLQMLTPWKVVLDPDVAGDHQVSLDLQEATLEQTLTTLLAQTGLAASYLDEAWHLSTPEGPAAAAAAPRPLATARVIANRPAGAWPALVVIDRGSNDGLERDRALELRRDGAAIATAHLAQLEADHAIAVVTAAEGAITRRETIHSLPPR